MQILAGTLEKLKNTPQFQIIDLSLDLAIWVRNPWKVIWATQNDHSSSPSQGIEWNSETGYFLVHRRKICRLAISRPLLLICLQGWEYARMDAYMYAINHDTLWSYHVLDMKTANVVY